VGEKEAKSFYSALPPSTPMVMALEGSRMLRFRLIAFDSDGDGATLPLATFDSAVFDGDDAKRGRKKTKAAERKRERDMKRKMEERENIVV
jgi:hypothetical protein